MKYQAKIKGHHQGQVTVSHREAGCAIIATLLCGKVIKYTV